MRVVIALLVCCCISLSPATAQESVRAAVDSAFAQGRYEQVELAVLRAERQLGSLPAADRVQINLTAGYALIMLGSEADAREYFRKALDADPATRLDPVRISPKFRMVFDDVKAQYRAGERQQRAAGTTLITGPRRSSVLTNLALPGSGQWREGQRARGLVWLGVQAAGVGVLVWRLGELTESREAYLSETDRGRVPSAYDRYEQDYRAAWAAGLAAGLVYLGSQVDLALLRHAAPHLEAGLLPEGGEIRLAWHF